MTEGYFKLKYVTLLQQSAWYIFLFGFAAATALLFLENSLADTVIYWGIVFVLLSTSLVIIVIGEQFRKTRLFRFWLLCYMLIVILLAVIVAKVYFA